MNVECRIMNKFESGSNSSCRLHLAIASQQQTPAFHKEWLFILLNSHIIPLNT